MILPPDHGPPARDYQQIDRLERLLFPPDGGPIIEAVVVKLMEDFRRRIERGEKPQLSPILAAPNLDTPDLLDVGDGRHRVEACRRLGLPVDADVRPEPFKKGEVNRIRASSVLNRKAPNPFELAEIAEAHKRIMAFETWAETGADLGFEPSTMTRVIAPRNIPEDLRSLTKPLGLVVVQSIGSLKERELIVPAIEFALGNGKPKTKDAVEAYVKQVKATAKGKKPTKVTPKHHELSWGVEDNIRAMSIRAKPDWKGVLDDLRLMVTLIERNEPYGDDAVIAILKARRQQAVIDAHRPRGKSAQPDTSPSA